ncbi:AraC family transcriptional regulator [Pseudomonas fragi]|uniref:AraC family transcriptional regulator n=1 Tax=Pseudomonas fragi TaxID=296 RepID=UPI000497BAA4|nr:AraC family transcriptional regulator [Pseudomonas fragi]MDE4513398.1 AraC family transcriptional regulator [Pseudomonas fragi]QPC34167.1 AraC family transcriptional regulator [Pseudomonas fragi]SDT94558.1 transcriptional regulator, AraC family [Pseudomonas fragi]
MPASSQSHCATPRFWRDAQLPFIEARSIADGRKVCYARHSHEIFSIGAITSGCCNYLHEKTSHRISTGTVVLMNPGDVHACNPVEDQPWSYVMLYVDAQWLAGIQQGFDEDAGGLFQPVAATYTQSPALFNGLTGLYAQLIDPELEVLARHEAAIKFFSAMQQELGGSVALPKPANARVERAAEYIDEHFLRTLRLQDICEAASLSEAYLIRAFEQRYHMTPHAYLINRRIQLAQAQLREGALIADIAQQTGFADQAHFQRVFKKHLAATPGQYKG